MRPKFVLNGAANNSCPCKGCKPPRRNSTCHGTCEDYIIWNTEHLQQLQEVYNSKGIDNALYYNQCSRNKKLKESNVKFGRKNNNGSR